MVDSRLWHKQTNRDEAAKIGSRVALMQDKPRQRRGELMAQFGSMYEGVTLSGIDGDCFDDLMPVNYDGAPLVNNRCQSVVDTLQAKLAGLDEPRPQFVVTDGTYEQKRQAVWLDRFVEGQFYQPQGMFKNMWDLWRHAFLIAAACTGTVAVKIFPDFQAKKICAELHNTRDMWVDSVECRYGAPLTYGESTWYDQETLLERYKNSPKKRDAILAAGDHPKQPGQGTTDTDAMQVRVHELWRVKTTDQPGKYIMLVGETALEWEDYPYATPPFAFYHFRRRLGGFWAACATETFYQSVIRENQVLNRMDEAEARSSTIIQYYDPVVAKQTSFAVPKHIVLIPYDSTQGPPPPPPFVIPWYPQTAPELMRIHGQNTHDSSGVAEMQTTGTAQAGLTAAIAIRTVLSLLNERLSPRQRDIVQATAVDSAYLFARAAKELYARFGEFSSEWHGKSWVKSVPGKDCLDLPDEIYTIQARPVSEKKNSPEDRLQLAQELVSQGVITGGDWLGVLRHMDTYGAMRKFSKVEEWCEDLFDRIQFAAESELHKPGFYTSPPKYMDLDYAMALSTDALLTAQIDRIPQVRIQLLLQFMSDLSRKIDQRDQRRLAMGQAPPPLPTPGGQPEAAPSAPQLPA
jgi:hypothetical protein